MSHLKVIHAPPALNFAIMCFLALQVLLQLWFHITSLATISHNRIKQTVYCPRLLDYVFNDDKEPWTWYAIHPPPLSSSWSTIVTLYCSWYTTIFFSSWASISLIFGSLSCSQLLDNLGEADMVWMIHDYWAKLLRTYKCLLTGTIRVYNSDLKKLSETTHFCTEMHKSYRKVLLAKLSETTHACKTLHKFKQEKRHSTIVLLWFF